jgi:hypothetical protein
VGIGVDTSSWSADDEDVWGLGCTIEECSGVKGGGVRGDGLECCGIVMEWGAGVGVNISYLQVRWLGACKTDFD